MRTLSAALLISVLICSSVGLGEEVSAGLTVTETLLCEISDEEAKDIVVSPDHKRTAFVKELDKGFCVIGDGKPGKTYTEVGKPFFSPDGKKMAYAAYDGKSWVMVEDGKVGAKYDNITTDLALFTPDSKEVAYVAKKDGKDTIVVGKKELKGYKEISEIRYSKDGKHMACHVLDYLASSVIPGSGMDQSFWSIDGSDLTDFCMPQTFVLSPDGKHWAIIGSKMRIGEMVDINDVGMFVFVDGDKREKLESTYTNSFSDFFVFSGDGKRLMYAVSEKKSCYIVLDKKKYGPYEGAAPGLFSTNGKIALWTAKADENIHLFSDGKKVAIPELEKGISGVHTAFTGDSGIAFSAQTDDGYTMVENGKAIGSYKWVSEPTYNAKGELCFIAYDGEKLQFIRKGEARFEASGKPYKGESFGGGHSFELTANGEGFACIAGTENGYALVVNGKLSSEFPKVLICEIPVSRVGDPSRDPMLDKGGKGERPKLPDNLPPGIDPDKIDAKKPNNWTRTSVLAINGDTVNFIAVKDGKLVKCEAKVK